VLVLAALSFLAIWRLRVGVVPVIASCAAAGLVASAL
jgi:hypothetical protein